MGNSPKKSKSTTTLLPNEISDFHNLTSFSDEILIKLHDHYKKFSSHLTDDGVIDYSEFCDIMGRDKNMTKRIFDAVDINKDGVINFREFLKYLSCFINGSLEEKTLLSFKLFSDENSKLIKKDTIINLLQDILLQEEKEVNNFFNEEEIKYIVDESFSDINKLIVNNLNKENQELEKTKIRLEQSEYNLNQRIDSINASSDININIKENTLIKENTNKLMKEIEKEKEIINSKKISTINKLNYIKNDCIDYNGYKSYIEKNPFVLEWLMIDLEKLQSCNSNDKKHIHKKVGCFGC